MDIEGIKQLAVDVNNVAMATAEPYQKQIELLRQWLTQIKKQFNEDAMKTREFHFPKPFCQNRPPEISKGWNACLSCCFNETCKLLYRQQ